MDYIGELIALGVDGVVFFVCLKQYLKNRRITNELKEAPVYEISPDLANIVRSRGDKRIPYAVVRGHVKAIGIPIDSTSAKGVTGVIQKVTVREHVASKGSHGFWSDSKRIIQETNNSVPFALVGKLGGAIEVLDAPTQAEMLELSTISDKFQPSESSGIVEHVWGYFAGIRRRGIQTTEEMLKEGAIVTGIGEITLNTSNTNILDDIKYVVKIPVNNDVSSSSSLLTAKQLDDSLNSGIQYLSNNTTALNLQSCANEALSDHPTIRIQQPMDGNLPLIVSHLPLPSLITRLQGRRKAFGWATAILGLTGLIISCWIAYKWYNAKRIKLESEESRRRREMERRERRRQARSLGTGHSSERKSIVDEIEEVHLCVVCRDNPKELILLPCGHVCICEDCLQPIKSKCPVCRAEVKSVNTAYIA
ncbi:hypothetical protein J437_LFUL018871 [Ladona fulva]|nr:hypothetical protein J437_LFUL018871 [Ladona fulva]